MTNDDNTPDGGAMRRSAQYSLALTDAQESTNSETVTPVICPRPSCTEAGSVMNEENDGVWACPACPVRLHTLRGFFVSCGNPYCEDPSGWAMARMFIPGADHQYHWRCGCGCTRTQEAADELVDQLLMEAAEEELKNPPTPVSIRVLELPDAWQEMIDSRGRTMGLLVGLTDAVRGGSTDLAHFEEVIAAIRTSLETHWHHREDQWLERWAVLEQEVRRLGGDPRTVLHRADAPNTRS